MTQMLWSQDFFAKGELSPLLYSRVTLQAYYQGLKKAKNIICFPQGTAGKRFGTIFQNNITTITGTSDYTQIFFKAFPYLNECTYQIVFYNNAVAIILEGEVIATVTPTGIYGDEVRLIDYTILDNLFRVTTGIHPPKDLTRTANSNNAITAFTSSTLTVTSALTLNGFWPARFIASSFSNLPTTSPQIHQNKTYFVRAVTTTKIQIYYTASDAATNINAFTISSAGTSANLSILNTWKIPDTNFRNYPTFDFTGGYDFTTFTPAAVSGYGIQILASPTTGQFVFTTQYIGGLFVGNGGVGRITITNPSSNYALINTIQPFTNTTAIPGKLVFISEPAWSTLRGWPSKCSTYQNRAFFANSDSLSNGLWGSLVNDYNDFDDSLGDDSNAISWFPSSDTVNNIQFIVPYRSLTIHTNSGVYSTPLSNETAITPSNFSLSLQDSTPAESVQPRGIDNQIIVISGNDVHSLLWDGFNNAYSSSIISIANEQLINNPIDEAAYVDLLRAGSRYIFIVNLDGSLAIYQSLIAENVSGFTPAYLEQSYGNAYFRSVASSSDGRAWFLTERQIATAQSANAITAFTSTTLDNSGGYSFPSTTFTAVTFSGTTLPTSSPQLETLTNYWAVGTTGTIFTVYLSQEDATNAVNAVIFSDDGTSATVTAYPLVTNLFMELMSFDVDMDCVGLYPTPMTSLPVTPVSSIAGNAMYDAQEIMMQGDGFGYYSEGVNDTVYFESHGVPITVSSAQYGFPINVEITPMPISLSLTGNPKSSILLNAKHQYNATLLFADTVGGFITAGNNTYPIALNKFNQANPNFPPVPTTGSFKMSLMSAWDDFNVDSFTINHSEPFGIKLTGIFYKLDV